MVEFIFLTVLPYLFTIILPITVGLLIGVPLLVGLIMTIRDKGIDGLLHDN